MLTPREANCLVTTAREFMIANVRKMSGHQRVTCRGLRSAAISNGEESLWVYGRRGKPYRECGEAIESEDSTMRESHSGARIANRLLHTRSLFETTLDKIALHWSGPILSLHTTMYGK